MQFSLRDLALVVAFIAFVAWCASLIGFGNIEFWFIVVVLGLMSKNYYFSSRLKKLGAIILTAFVACCALVVISVPIVVGALLFVFAAIVSARYGPLKFIPSIRISMAITTVALAAGLLPGLIAARKLDSIRRAMPVVSLERRLAYERLRSQPNSQSAVELSSATLADLIITENQIDSNSNLFFDLTYLHDRRRKLFAQAMGFGVTRMVRWKPEQLLRPPLRDIHFNDSDAIYSGGQQGNWLAFWSLNSWDFSTDSARNLHLASRTDFLDPDSFGLETGSRLEFTGFVEHGFHNPPTANSSSRNWRIERLELVSLLKFESPRVYLLDHLPRMDQLSSDTVRTRQLDSFESDALAQLRTEKDIVLTNDGPNYRMLGSLRATKQCIECHNVQRGELLGAFSYVLHQNQMSKNP